MGFGNSSGSPFSSYVKRHYRQIATPGMAHADVMRAIGKRWKNLPVAERKRWGNGAAFFLAVTIG